MFTATPHPVSTAPAVALRDVRKVHGTGDGAVVALDGVSVALQRASFTAIWRQHFSNLWISSFGGTFAAMMMIVLARQDAFQALLLVTPLPVVLYVALRHALGRAEDRIDHLGKMNRVYVATIEALAHAVDAKDQVSHDHVRSVL